MEQIEQRISSREVAEMMEMEHKVLLRKIDGIIEDLAEHKIVLSKYWEESQYKDASGKSNREFRITKRGCEFLAHKSTGTKGNLFTDRYMDRFSAMEEVIRNGAINITADEKEKVKLMNARSRMANTYMRLANVDTVSKEYKNILVAKAAEVLNGESLLPLPKQERKTYSATEIGDLLGVSSQKIGRIATAHNLKTPEYGEFYRDKARYSSKEVDSFRYYENAIDVFRGLLSA